MDNKTSFLSEYKFYTEESTGYCLVDFKDKQSFICSSLLSFRIMTGDDKLRFANKRVAEKAIQDITDAYYDAIGRGLKDSDITSCPEVIETIHDSGIDEDSECCIHGVEVKGTFDNVEVARVQVSWDIRGSHYEMIRKSEYVQFSRTVIEAIQDFSPWKVNSVESLKSMKFFNFDRRYLHDVIKLHDETLQYLAVLLRNVMMYLMPPDKVKHSALHEEILSSCKENKYSTSDDANLLFSSLLSIVTENARTITDDTPREVIKYYMDDGIVFGKAHIAKVLKKTNGMKHRIFVVQIEGRSLIGSKRNRTYYNSNDIAFKGLGFIKYNDAVRFVDDFNKLVDNVNGKCKELRDKGHKVIVPNHGDLNARMEHFFDCTSGYAVTIVIHYGSVSFNLDSIRLNTYCVSEDNSTDMISNARGLTNLMQGVTFNQLDGHGILLSRVEKLDELSARLHLYNKKITEIATLMLSSFEAMGLVSKNFHKDLADDLLFGRSIDIDKCESYMRSAFNNAIDNFVKNKLTSYDKP